MGLRKSTVPRNLENDESPLHQPPAADSPMCEWAPVDAGGPSDVESPEVEPVRHAVIIAAGAGSRLLSTEEFAVKPLVEVAGLPLIERAVRTAHKAGITEFTVVTGFRAERLEKFLGGLVIPGVKLRWVRNARWQGGNGLSVMAARPFCRRPFILMMADHLLDHRILQCLTSAPLPEGHCRLGVDFRHEQVFDIEDATKVRVGDGHIEAIGKDLHSYNGVDTGVFLCCPSVFEALEDVLEQGRESLSDGIERVARKGCMEAVDIGGLFWEDVDNENDLRHAEKRLLQNLVSSTDSWITRNVNRRISLAVTRRLAATSIRPNHVTLFNIAVGLTGAAMMLGGSTAGLFLGACLFLASSILDGCDGELARLKFQESRLGAWLDVTGDNVTHIALFACLTIGLIRKDHSLSHLLPGALLLTATLYTMYLAFQTQKKLAPKGMLFSSTGLQRIAPAGSDRNVTRWLDKMANRDFAYLLLVLTAIGEADWFLRIATVGAVVFGLFFTRVVARQSPEADALAAGPEARTQG